VLWLVIVGAAGKVTLDNAQALKRAKPGHIGAGKPVLALCGMVLTKTVTSLATLRYRRFGGEVHTMGIMFMIYPDAVRGCDIVLVVPEALGIVCWRCAG